MQPSSNATRRREMLVKYLNNSVINIGTVKSLGRHLVLVMCVPGFFIVNLNFNVRLDMLKKYVPCTL